MEEIRISDSDNPTFSGLARERLKEKYAEIDAAYYSANLTKEEMIKLKKKAYLEEISLMHHLESTFRR